MGRRISFFLFLLSLICIAYTRGALAQNKPANLSLLDMSVEDLMSIKIDSVYGASGFEQKVT